MKDKIMIYPETEITYCYKQHVGPRIMSAGLTIEVLYDAFNELTITCIKKYENEKYKLYYQAAKNGFIKGINDIFGNNKCSGLIKITDMKINKIHSGELAFYKCARSIIHTMSPKINEYNK